MRPAVSVLLPVHDGEEHLAAALDSLLAQTFRDFELVVVDDGSTDGTSAILARYAAADRRIVPLALLENRGLVAALNHGFTVTRAPLVARHDADDVALPARLERQVEWLDGHPEVGMIACDYLRRHDDGRTTAHRPPRGDLELRWRMLFGNVWPHPAVVFRRALFGEGEAPYRDVALAEDYDLWLRLLERTRAATVPETLLVVRTHRHSGISAPQHDRQQAVAGALAAERLRALLPGRQLDDATLDRLTRCRRARGLSADDVAAAALLLELFDAFAARERPPASEARRLRRQVVAGVLAAAPASACWRQAGALVRLARAEPGAVAVAAGRRLARPPRQAAAALGRRVLAARSAGRA
jgi:hypothetical protein